MGNTLPEKIGHYKVVSELGRGGMGVVYKAHEESLNRFVAIKVLGDHLAADEQFLSRFTREARAAGAVAHPNVIPIYFIGQDDGRHYFAMEYVSGRSVQAMIRQEGRIGNPRAAQIILQAAQGLGAAHDKGVIHRDIKPANLMVDERGVVKIADFGIALPVESQTRLTATGALMGTPGYLSPEHCMGEAVDHRADIYALGVTYFEMLTGRMPFNAESPLALLRQILQEEVPDVTQLNSEVDAESKRILMKMIARDRNARYQNCHELVADLEEYLAKHNVRSVTANLALRSTAAVNAASTPTVATPALSPTVAITGASQAPTLITANAGSAAAATAKVTAPGGVAYSQPATNPGQQPAQAGAYVPPPQAQKKSSFALIAAVLIIAVVIAAGAAGMIGYKLYKGGKLFGAGKQATEASVLPAVGNTQQQSSSIPSADATKPVSQEKVELANANPTALNALTSTQSIDAQTQSQSQSNASTSPAGNQQQAAAVEKKQPVKVASAASTNAQERSSKRLQSQSEGESAPPAAHLSNVVFDVQGDPAVTGALGDVLSSEFSAAGLQAKSVEDVNDRLAGAPASDLVQRLHGRAGVIVVAKVEPAGQREIQYMGRYDILYGSRITMTAYDAATGHTIGSRVSANMESTQLNLQQKAEQAAGPLARKLIEQIQNR